MRRDGSEGLVNVIVLVEVSLCISPKEDAQDSQQKMNVSESHPSAALHSNQHAQAFFESS